MLLDVRTYVCKPGTIKKHLALYESVCHRAEQPDDEIDR